jgi:hypothetical protein
MDWRTYSDNNLEQIAASISVSVSLVYPHRHSFESTATWYRSDSRAPSRVPPSTTKRSAKLISAAARKLLQHLKVGKGYADDGPEDWGLLQALSCTGHGSEDEVIRATGRVGRLAEIFEAIEAAQLLHRWANKAAEDAAQSSLSVPKGRRGELAENDWIASQMSLYEKITGRKARTSVIAPGRPGRGKPAGPLIRFLAAAGKPLGIKHSADSWRARIRDIRADVDPQK